MAQANKQVLMAALTYNLKKYLKFSRKTVRAMVVALSKTKENTTCLLNAFYQIVFELNEGHQKIRTIALQ